MPTKTYKFKVQVNLHVQGVSKTIYPIIEASSETEAKQIAKAQYLTGTVINATKVI